MQGGRFNAEGLPTVFPLALQRSFVPPDGGLHRM
jgi:hypothetical protein